MSDLRRAVRPSHLFPVLLVGALASACIHAQPGSRPEGAEPGGTVINGEQIAGMNVRTALEVVERGAKHLVIQRTREGTPARIYQRGIGSIYLDAQPLVVVDGAMVNEGVNALANIHSAHVEYIQILNAREATLRYGANGGNGAIIVKTSAG